MHHVLILNIIFKVLNVIKLYNENKESRFLVNKLFLHIFEFSFDYKYYFLNLITFLFNRK
ncbi:hypothetical protein PFNF135_06145 [Plasmodium falciparum NF135/5.C10]|uniref:Uncharacterized protein n=1 Tax=Plasmodium falciparum NF135/5.C10 TaxID=1036726 RepID=W4I8L3_PLAFA|nr:hypothetical protein PFNF135_06145 [Plasmodium falciparum NF135/5.C10]